MGIQSLPFQVYQSMCRTSMTSNTIHKYRTETSSQMDMTSCSHINMCSQNIPQHIIIIPPPLNLIPHQNHTNQKSHTSRRNTKRKNLTNLKNLTKKKNLNHTNPVTHIKQTQ